MFNNLTFSSSVPGLLCFLFIVPLAGNWGFALNKGPAVCVCVCVCEQTFLRKGAVGLQLSLILAIWVDLCLLKRGGLSATSGYGSNLI